MRGFRTRSRGAGRGRRVAGVAGRRAAGGAGGRLGASVQWLRGVHSRLSRGRQSAQHGDARREQIRRNAFRHAASLPQDGARHPADGGDAACPGRPGPPAAAAAAAVRPGGLLCRLQRGAHPAPAVQRHVCARRHRGRLRGPGRAGRLLRHHPHQMGRRDGGGRARDRRDAETVRGLPARARAELVAPPASFISGKRWKATGKRLSPSSM